MKHKIEIAITSTGKPSIRVEIETLGTETEEEIQHSREIAWTAAEEEYKRIKKKYLTMCTELR